MSDNLDAALKYAAQGWYVFPCKASKAPYTSNGFKNATTDTDQINKWWKRWPGALVGISCQRSGVFAVDIDCKNGRDGKASWEKWVKDHNGGKNVQCGPCQKTPSGGRHLLFKMPDDIEIPNTSDKLAEGIDLRSRGYICSGGPYAWEVDHGPETPITEAPAWLLEIIAKQQKPAPQSETERPRQYSGNNPGEHWLKKYLSIATVGNRNATGFDLACQLRDSGLSKAEARRYMQEYARGVPGKNYTEKEALLSLKSAYSTTQRDPAKNNTPAPKAGTVPIEEPAQPEDPDDITPALPETAQLEEPEGNGACKWLEDYIRFSKKWSPRAYDLFHESCALWLLSTIAARRVMVHFGKPRYTNLYISLVARSSLYAKSSTADIAIQTLYDAGLAWLLAADSSTPQKFISDMTVKLPEGYDDLDAEQQEYKKLRVGMAGQCGWFYEEFGQHISSMMREGGIMADFRGLLRRFDDTPQLFKQGTISRGDDTVERPYLALLANMTPADLRPYAKKSSSLWGDGFLARFALITPPEGEGRKGVRFPKGERTIPHELLEPLRNWNQALGLPEVIISTTDDGKKRANCTPPEVPPLDLPSDVFDAVYNYHDSLLSIIEGTENTDLDANYSRFAEKALRIAALLTSLDGEQAINMKHWAKGQAITERWRSGLHELYAQLNEPPPSEEKNTEERVIQVIKRRGRPTKREVRQYTNLSATETNYYVEGLLKQGIIGTAKEGRKHVLFILEV
jgi:hypothetical protein